MRMCPSRVRRFLALLFAILVAGCTTPGLPSAVQGPAAATAAKEAIAPERGSGFRALAPVYSQHTMVGAANPYASEAGLEMLRAGGNAVDASIAISMVLNLVEPQSSGIGGGGFLLYFDRSEGQVIAYDGRETAPAAATPDMFLDAAGKPRAFLDAVVGGLSVGTPGLLRMLEKVHHDHGKLPWAKLFDPAIRLAEGGFIVSPRLHALIAQDPLLGKMEAARAYFFDAEGKPLPVGSRRTNRPLAEVLRRVASEGADAFYTGAIAEEIVQAVRTASRNPGRLELPDLQAYQAKVRPAVCGPYRDWQVCGVPPPTSGGVSVLQILGILSDFDLADLSPDSVETTHLFVEASRLAYADRGLYLADPDFVPNPVDRLLDPAYLSRRATLVKPNRSMGTAAPGKLDDGAMRWAPDQSPELPATSHMVAVDADGDVVSMTQTVESAFGSRLMVHGFLLNNELTDFSFVPEADGLPVANRVEPGKRPRSSMAPTIVLDRTGKQFKLATGSPGGSQIIDYVAQVLVSVREWNMDIQQAIARPHVVNRNGKTELEAVPGHEAWLREVSAGLTALGHEVEVRELNSGLQGIMSTGTGYVGGADPRREGVILGD